MPQPARIEADYDEVCVEGVPLRDGRRQALPLGGRRRRVRRERENERHAHDACVWLVLMRAKVL